MDPDQAQRDHSLRRLCNGIIIDQPQAICMAVIELDCGCFNVCGVSVSGQPVGRVSSISGPLEVDGSARPVCITCAGAGGPMMGRIVGRELIWPGGADERPDRALREWLAHEVFGPDFHEPQPG